MLSQEIIDQIRAARAAREASKTTETHTETTDNDDDIDENFDPIRNIDPNADKELHGTRLNWTGW